MLKKVLLAAIIAAPLCLSAQTVKLGAVSPQELVAVMPETATANNTLKAASDKYDAQAKVLQDEYQKKMDEFNAIDKNNEAAQEAKAKEIQDLQVRMQNFPQTASQDLQKQQETLYAPIQQKLQQAIQQVGAEGGYAGILYKDVLLYQGTGIEDITAKVKAKLGIK